MRIITVTRQFGSGGRELGKRLSDLLGFDHSDRTQLLRRQREIIRAVAQAGNDCIIVGRDADVILGEYRPFRVYVCAEPRSRLDRCMAHEEKKPREQRLTEREVLRNIRRIDANRAHTREVLTGKTRDDGSAFDLTVNAGGWELKKLTAAVAEFALRWFEAQGF